MFLDFCFQKNKNNKNNFLRSRNKQTNEQNDNDNGQPVKYHAINIIGYGKMYKM